LLKVWLPYKEAISPAIIKQWQASLNPGGNVSPQPATPRQAQLAIDCRHPDHDCREPHAETPGERLSEQHDPKKNADARTEVALARNTHGTECPHQAEVEH
jgi:hypothetical protein